MENNLLTTFSIGVEFDKQELTDCYCTSAKHKVRGLLLKKNVLNIAGCWIV